MSSTGSTKKHFSLLIKPASADCNLRCSYCFYLDHASMYPETGKHRMSVEVLERMIESYMQTEQQVYSFGWQGGEPTLMGVDFFKTAVELQKRYAQPGAVVSNGLQTNATLIDDDFAAHLAEYNYLVGVSIDGPPDLHDVYRKAVSGKGSHESVINGIDALNRYKVSYNALVLVSSANVEYPERVYDYLKGLGIFYHQYIPCVEFDESGNPLPYTISGKPWGQFLQRNFDRWLAGDTGHVSIRDFDAILHHLVNGGYTMCVQSGYCDHYLVVEYNGDIYPCDFFVERSTRLGNTGRDSWESVRASARYRSFAALKSDWSNTCATCEFLRYCSGDCLKQRYRESRDSRNLSWLCEGWKAFYLRAIPIFSRLAVEYLNKRELELPPPQREVSIRPPALRIGWNDPCFCGSGKKYRLCHGTSVSRRTTR